MNSSTSTSPGRKVEFAAPQGFSPPEAAESGEWDMVCSFKTDPETGQICMTKLGDTPMPSYDEGAKPESKPSYEGMAQSMMSEKIAGSESGSA